MGVELLWSFPLLAVALHLVGLVCAAEAVRTARTAQGAVAWALSLIMLPLVALPLYLVFGRGGFWGYVERMREAETRGRAPLSNLFKEARTLAAEVGPERAMDVAMLSLMTMVPCTRGNRARLLVDGEQTFAAIFEAIRGAKSYVLVQFFIIHDDQVGGELKELLLAKRREGVRVYVMYDEIGSHALTRSWKNALREAGAEVTPFGTTRGWKNRFQLNFRNHRKIVVVDGREAFLGGLNVGDEYLGRSKRFGHWRDTHLGVRGPAVQAVQLSFIMDWFWATEQLPELEWKMEPAADGTGKAMLLIPTGPADSDNWCEMMFMQAAQAARRRLWITSPYFVPSPAVLEMLRLAARRGVDVRVIIPRVPDHLMVYLAGFQYVAYARRAGVKVYRYGNGFLHEKVILIDDDLATVGTANLDTRSLRLNFEMTMWCVDRGFAAEVEKMLEADLADSTLVERDELEGRSWFFGAASRVARLMEPVL
jgi:cardiolipin synthase